MQRAARAGLVVAAALWAGRAHAADVVTGRLLGEARRAVVVLTIAPGWHINGHAPRDPFLIPTELQLVPPPGVDVGPVQYPEPVDRVLPFSAGKPMLLYEGDVRLVAALEGATAPGALPLRATVRYQACDDTHCLPPRTLELVAPSGGPPAAAAAGNEVERWITRWGYAPTLLWVALLGVGLNLTPCVYPLISVTVAFFGGRHGSRGGTVGRALVYVLGICLAFSALGVAAALTGSLFGIALQQPAVLGGIASLMVALALSNFGLYRVRMPAGIMQWAARTGEGTLGALFMGLTMGIVAAPCIAPVVVALLLFVGARQSAALGFAFFFALALGMGAPYVGLALLAGRLRRLPRSGAWLEWMERLFAFMLLGLALHFASPLLAPAWVRGAWAALLASAGLVLGFLGAAGRPAVRWSRRTAGLAAIALGAGTLLVAEAESPIQWVPLSEEAVGRARAAGRPVFIDFEAEWCLPCREMDRTTFRDPAVVRAASDFAMLRADVTSQDDRAATLMDGYHVSGVPTYLLLGPDGGEARRLVGFVAAVDLLRAMEDAARRG